MTVALTPVDSVEVTLVMDLSLDILMAGQEGVQRFKVAYDWSDHDSLLAEHGFSALITVEAGGRRQSVLYDGGLSALALQHNLDVMQIDVSNLRAIAISHGHVDHHGGLEGLFRRGVTLVATSNLPPRQVARVTSYEKGFPVQVARSSGGDWEPDPWTWDDQNIVVNVRDRGLVIVSGCSHAGVVNVIRNAQQLTGEARVAGVIGGFHLTGALFEPLIPETIADITAIGVERIVPAHCTGWRAMHALARAMPEAFVQPSVGTVFEFRAP